MSGNFYPSLSFIQNITQAQEAVVTFTVNHEFTEGEFISFRVSKPFGMVEMNNRRGKVVDLTNNTVTVDIDSSGFSPFVFATGANIGAQPAIAVPAGSGVIPNEIPPTVNLIDSFDDVPP